MRSVDESLKARHRRDVDDAAGPALEHGPPGRLGEQERAREIGLEHPVPFIERHVFRVGAPADSGVVHENVHLAEGAKSEVNYRLYVPGASDVAWNRLDGVPVLPQFNRGGFQPFGATGAQDEACAGLGQAFSHLASQPARSSGDDSHPVVQAEKLSDGAHPRLILRSAAEVNAARLS